MAKPHRRKSAPTHRPRAADSRASERARIVSVALEMAAEGRWPGARMSDIADRTGVPIENLHRRFPSRNAIVDAFFRDIDAAMLADKCYRPDDPAPARDRLFDVLMRRIEALTPHKAAFAAFMRGARHDPCAALAGACRLGRTLRLMLEAAGLPSSGAGGLLRIKGLGLIWLNTVRVWLRDDSVDLAKTMAALDKGLRQAEAAIRFLPGGRPPPAGNRAAS